MPYNHDWGHIIVMGLSRFFGMVAGSRRPFLDCHKVTEQRRVKEIAFVCTGSLTILRYGRGVTPVVAVNMVLME